MVSKSLKQSKVVFVEMYTQTIIFFFILTIAVVYRDNDRPWDVNLVHFALNTDNF